MASKATIALVIIAAATYSFASDRLLGLLANTGLLTLGALAISLPVGSLLGVYIAKTDLVGRQFSVWACVGLLFVPLYVQAAAWNAAIGPGGWLTQIIAATGCTNAWLAGWNAVIWIHAMGAVPSVALLTAASLSTVERRLEEESLLDASPLRVLCCVSLRRGSGGLWAAAVWIAVGCATEIAVTDLYQVRTFAEEIYTQASLGPLSDGPNGFVGTDLAMGVSLIALLVPVAWWLATPWLPAAAAVQADATWRWRPTVGRRLLVLMLSMFIATAIVTPLAGLVWKSGIAVKEVDGQFQRSWSAGKSVAMVLQSPWDHRREWGWSLAIGGISAVTAVAAGAVAAWAVRLRPFVAMPVGVLIAIGMAAPAPLLGVWVIAALNRPADSTLSFLTLLYDRTIVGPVLVQTARALPLVVLWLWSQFRTVPQDLLEAARSEGAGPMQLLARIALPLRRAGLWAALLIGFVLAVGEVAATLLVTPPGVTTISMRVFQLLHYGVDDRVAALSLSIVLGLGGVLVPVAFSLRRRSQQ